MGRRVDLTRFLALLDAVPVPVDATALHAPGSPAGALRRRNLLRYLSLMADVGPDTILVGEAPGYRGAAVTGIPFMSVRELAVRPGLVSGAVGGDGFETPVPHDGAVPVGWEATSAAVWRSTAAWDGPLPLAWPIYPHHPFVAGSALTNRTPRPAEVRAGAPVALELIAAFGITQVVAVGRKAEHALAVAGVDAVAVRHPAQGGAAIFARQLRELNHPLTHPTAR